MTTILIDFIWCCSTDVRNPNCLCRAIIERRLILCQTIQRLALHQDREVSLQKEARDRINASTPLQSFQSRQASEMWMICCENWIRHKLDVIDAELEITLRSTCVRIAPLRSSERRRPFNLFLGLFEWLSYNYCWLTFTSSQDEINHERF